jgi:hypothetical protein
VRKRKEIIGSFEALLRHEEGLTNFTLLEYRQV